LPNEKEGEGKLRILILRNENEMDRRCRDKVIRGYAVDVVLDGKRKTVKGIRRTEMRNLLLLRDHHHLEAC